ncbi:MAG: CoA ester lyase [Gemmatimonadaceae bacterium]
MSASSMLKPFPQSLLFVPANRTDMFARAWESEAQAIIFDLEDSVPTAQKVAARQALLSLQIPEGWTRAIYVRVNSYGTENFALDLQAVTNIRVPIAGVMLPKVERAAQVVAVNKAIAACERVDRSDLSGKSGQLEQSQRPSEPLALILLIETPAGVMRAADLADCGVKRVVAFAFGAEDYRAGMRVDVLDPALADFARATVSNAAAAAGIPAIDAPLLQIDSPDALRAATLHARALGFASKFAIHPSQIAVIHDAFANDALAGGIDRAWALRAVEAYERATRDGQGSVALDGRMIDEATMKRVRDILKT